MERSAHDMRSSSSHLARASCNRPANSEALHTFSFVTICMRNRLGPKLERYFFARSAYCSSSTIRDGNVDFGDIILAEILRNDTARILDLQKSRKDRPR